MHQHLPRCDIPTMARYLGLLAQLAPNGPSGKEHGNDGPIFQMGNRP